MRVIPAALFWMMLAGMAQAKIYLCSVATDPSMGGYISNVYVIDVDEKNQRIIVDDAVIEYFLQGPVEAFTPRISATTISFNWDVLALNIEGQRAKLSYRGVLFLRDMTFRVSMKPIDYGNSFDGHGRCRSK